MVRKTLGEDYFSKEGIKEELTQRYKNYGGKLSLEQFDQLVEMTYELRNRWKGALFQARTIGRGSERKKSSLKRQVPVSIDCASNSSKKNSKPKPSIIDVNGDKFSKLVQEVYNSGQSVYGDFNLSKEYNYGGQDFKYKQKIILFDENKFFLYSDDLFFESEKESIKNVKDSLEYFAGKGSIAKLSDFKEVGKGLEGKFEIYHSPIRGSDHSPNSSDQLSLNI